MAARLVRKAEERKEDKRARDQQPAIHLETILEVRVILPVRRRDLEDSRIVALVVRLRPAFPTFQMEMLVVMPIERNDICSNRDGAE